MIVGECMSRHPATCTDDQRLDAVARVMEERDCGIVPIVDGAQRVVGLLTDRDIMMAASRTGRALRHISVASVMAKVVRSIGPEDTTEAAEDLLRKHQVRRLPVVDREGRLLGMLSLADLFRARVPAAERSDERGVTRLARTFAQVVRENGKVWVQKTQPEPRALRLREVLPKALVPYALPGLRPRRQTFPRI